MKIICGPVPCQGCREYVFLSRGPNGKDRLRWRDADQLVHDCKGMK